MKELVGESYKTAGPEIIYLRIYVIPVNYRYAEAWNFPIL